MEDKEGKIWLEVDRDSGERWAMILSEDIRAKRFNNMLSWQGAARTLLDKIQAAQAKHEYIIYINEKEASLLLACINCYLDGWFTAPFDKPQKLYSVRVNEDRAPAYPSNTKVAVQI